MINRTKHDPKHNQWDSRLFLVAGCFMIINTALLWVRLYSSEQLSILWAAIPAIIGLSTSVIGLLTLYPRIASSFPKLSKGGAGFALLALLSLGIAAGWIFVVSVFGDGFPQPAPNEFLLLVAVFMITTVLAFITNMTIFLRHTRLRKIGYCLAIPVAMWATMLAIGVFQGMAIGLSLDYYTNGIIGGAFVTLGVYLHRVPKLGTR